ncbi:hypothetical protein [Glaciecola petra]|uniref:Lipoprotein n=1 Tax=Glaciecola petra TaxID=3075602 RepID=A0ABU2ZRK9_9ALTE|nr:hypothetical protein [Aestuariibacter sp. P117]MDT0594954.1 hypothetical protein [Aestuariibacter sp. P117]
MKFKKLALPFTISVVFALSACGSTDNNSDSGLGPIMKTALCAAGGFAGAYIGKELADKYFEKTNTSYTGQEREILTKGFQVGLFLTFCGVANYAGETIYKKLSEDGLAKRKEQVLQAAVTSESTTYFDPQNPDYRGSVDIIDRYTENDGNRYCVVAKDTLSIDQTSESILVTQCRNLPNGEFEVVAV